MKTKKKSSIEVSKNSENGDIKLSNRIIDLFIWYQIEDSNALLRVLENQVKFLEERRKQLFDNLDMCLFKFQKKKINEELEQIEKELFKQYEKIGEISGFDIVGTKDELWYKPIIYIKGIGKYKVEVNNNDEIGNILKLENTLKSFENKINTVTEQIAYTEKQLIDIKEELDKPFANQDRIRELQKEQARIDSELDLDKQESTRSVEENNEDEYER